MVRTLRFSAHLSDGAGIILLRLLPLRHRRPALERAQIIDEQLPIEVINLVQDASAEQLGAGGLVRVAVLVRRPNRDSRRALDIAVDVGNGEAPFLRLFFFAFSRDDGGIDERELLPPDIDDSEPFRPPHLGRRESDSLGGVHCLEHVGDELAQLVGDIGDGPCRLAKNRVAQHPDVEDAHPALTLEAEVSLLIFAMRPRSMMTRVSPDLMVTRSSIPPALSSPPFSLMNNTSPTRPPFVTISSPFLRLCTSSSCFLRCVACGRMRMK